MIEAKAPSTREVVEFLAPKDEQKPAEPKALEAKPSANAIPASGLEGDDPKPATEAKPR